MIYLDSSALFKHYYEEPGSDTIRRVFHEPKLIATASLSSAEVFSALNRKFREKAIDTGQYQAAAEEFEEDWRRFTVVPLSGEVLRTARVLLERYALRAGDAVQLASCQVLAMSVRAEFASADRRLNQAAEAEGFSLLL